MSEHLFRNSGKSLLGCTEQHYRPRNLNTNTRFIYNNSNTYNLVVLKVNSTTKLSVQL